MKITNYMIHKWSKAGLLVVFGIILLIFYGKVIAELQPAFERLIGGGTPMLFDLLNAIGWIIILWCFVDAALNILTSFRESRLSLDEIGAKLDAIEKKLSPQPPEAAQKPLVVEQEEVGIEEPEPEEITPAPPTPPVPPPP